MTTEEKKLDRQAEDLVKAAMVPLPTEEKKVEELTDEELYANLAATIQEEKKEDIKKKQIKTSPPKEKKKKEASKKAKASSRRKVNKEKCECEGPNDGCDICGRLPGDPWNPKCGWKNGKVKIPTPTQNSVLVLQAFRDWRDKIAYIDSQGNYHLKTKGKEKGPNAPWNKEIKKAYPTVTEFHIAYKKASKKGLLKKGAPTVKTKDAIKILHNRYIKDDPKRLASVKKEREKNKREVERESKKLLRRRNKPIKESIKEKEIAPRLLRRGKEEKEIPRDLPEGDYVKNFSDEDNLYAIGKSVSADSIHEMYESGLKAIQNHLTNICPKIYIVDVLLPRHRVPKSRYLIEEASPQMALTRIRNENEKRAKARKKLLFQEDDVIKLLVPTFNSRIMEV